MNGPDEESTSRYKTLKYYPKYFVSSKIMYWKRLSQDSNALQAKDQIRNHFAIQISPQLPIPRQEFNHLFFHKIISLRRLSFVG